MNALHPIQNFPINPVLMLSRPYVIKGKKSSIVLIDR
jgi:hypothetical protein